MKDSKTKSVVETTFNVIIGGLVGFTLNITILPLFGMPPNTLNAVYISIIFLIAGFIKTYVVRRIFVNGFYEWIQKVKS